MLKNLIIGLIPLMLQCFACGRVPTPIVEEDSRWNAYSYENGIIIPNNIVPFYKDYYPKYYSKNRHLMSILSKQYNNRIEFLSGQNSSYYNFSFQEPNSSKIIERVRDEIQSEYSSSVFMINGCRTIDTTDMSLFNRLYKWYNFGYSDGFYLNIWSDEDLFRKVNVLPQVARSARLIIDCTIEIDEDIKSNELYYFDDAEHFLFKIIVCQ